MKKKVRGTLHNRIKNLTAKFYSTKPERSSTIETLARFHFLGFKLALEKFSEIIPDHSIGKREVFLTGVLDTAQTVDQCVQVSKVEKMSKKELIEFSSKVTLEEMIEKLPTTECALLVGLEIVRNDKISSKERKYGDVSQLYISARKRSLVAPILISELIAVSYDQSSAFKSLKRAMGDTVLVRKAFLRLLKFIDPTGRVDHSTLADAFRLIRKPEYFDSIRDIIMNLKIDQLKALLETADRDDARLWVTQIIAEKLVASYSVTLLAGRMTVCADAREVFALLMNKERYECVKHFVHTIGESKLAKASGANVFLIGCIVFEVHEHYFETITFDVLDHVDRYVSDSVPAKEWIKPKLNELEDEERRNRSISI